MCLQCSQSPWLDSRPREPRNGATCQWRAWCWKRPAAPRISLSRGLAGSGAKTKTFLLLAEICQRGFCDRGPRQSLSVDQAQCSTPAGLGVCDRQCASLECLNVWEDCAETLSGGNIAAKSKQVIIKSGLTCRRRMNDETNELTPAASVGAVLSRRDCDLLVGARPHCRAITSNPVST